MRIPTLLAPAAAVLLSLPAAAQNSLTLEVDRRYRMVAPTAGMSEPTPGSVVELRRDTVVFQVESNAQLVVPLAAITQVERSRGTQRIGTAVLAGLAGAGLGGLAFQARGAVLGDTKTVSCLTCPSGYREVRVEPSSTMRASFIGGGAVIGVGLGWMIGQERWRTVPLYAGSAPDGERGELALQLRF